MRIPVRQARARFASLLSAVEQGESVEITRHGRVVARMSAPAAEADSQDRCDARQRLRSSLPAAQHPAADTVRALRQER